MVDPSRAQQGAEDAWRFFGAHATYGAALADWTTSTTPDGAPMVSAHVTGPDAEQAMRAFAADYMLITTGPDRQHAHFDYSEPGLVQCVWRTDGVWVRLWADEHQQAAPVAARVSVDPVQRSRVGRLMSQWGRGAAKPRW